MFDPKRDSKANEFERKLVEMMPKLKAQQVTCETCQYWGRYDDELGECQKLAIGHYIEDLSGSVGIFARDSEQANGDGSEYEPVYTEPDFSCAFHEPSIYPRAAPDTEAGDER